MLDENVIKKIYDSLGDDLSKEIFTNRFLYSITQDSRYIFKIISTTKYGKYFIDKLETCQRKRNGVIFGAGVWGKDLYRFTKEFSWKFFIDSRPKQKRYEDLPIVSYRDFISNYCDEDIFISSRLYHKEMKKQLLNDGIREEKIVDVGKMLDELSQNQYFDLPEMRPQKEEIFVDAGSFDGKTSLLFQKWAGKNSFVYAFEPDLQNSRVCRNNFEKEGIKNIVIEKGLWKEKGRLQFCVEANGASAVSTDGKEYIDVTTLDEEIRDNKISFIKMDIEGSEEEALLGAKRVIKKNLPKLAISIYHRPEDIWRLPQLVLALNDNYRLFLRHYSLTDFETVLYALTNKGNHDER